MIIRHRERGPARETQRRIEDASKEFRRTLFGSRGRPINEFEASLQAAFKKAASFGLTIGTMALLLWLALIFIFPHLDLDANEEIALEAPRVATYLALRLRLPQAEVRLVPLKGNNLRVYLPKSALESVPFPDRDDFVSGIAVAWCDGVGHSLVPSVDFRDIRTGQSLANYNCVFSSPGKSGRH